MPTEKGSKVASNFHCPGGRALGFCHWIVGGVGDGVVRAPARALIEGNMSAGDGNRKRGACTYMYLFWRFAWFTRQSD